MAPSSSSSSNSNNNIFLTTENLAFAFPLILVCSVYVYFKYVPLHIALGILVGIYLLYQVQSKLQSNKNKKLETLDEHVVRDLIGDDNNYESNNNATKLIAAATKQRKAKARLELRLARERKQRNANDDEDFEEEEEDADALLTTFAKGSRDSKKKK